MALPVTSLEGLSGNPELAHLFVRLTPDGKLLFLEDYEDGSYIDVYQRVESKKPQMHARAADTGELQTGSSYLHTVGRRTILCAHRNARCWPPAFSTTKVNGCSSIPDPGNRLRTPRLSSVTCCFFT